MIKIALLETIEALVSAIKSKFLTKTEAESIYQPKDTAINTSNIGSQSVSYASSAYRASNADEANELHGHATFSTSFPSQGQGLLRYYISASNYDGQPPADGAILYMGATNSNGKDHQVAFCDDGELYIKHMIDGTWQPWNRMAKASEIPDVSGFATEDWVKRHYYDFEEMGNLFYTMDDVDSKLADVDSTFANYLPKSGGTITGGLKVNGRLNIGNVANIESSGSGYTSLSTNGVGFGIDSDLLIKGGVRLAFNKATNTLNISGASGQTVHIAVNGEVIA